MKNIAVVGSGTMGNGIAHTFAQFGFNVNLIDVKAEVLTKSLNIISKNLDRQMAKNIISETDKKVIFKRITTFTHLKQGVADADLVVEAATENTELKLNIFKDLDKFSKPDAILASNTSSISVTQIAAVTNRGHKVIGMHFMNPVPVMQLVEIIRGYQTGDDTCAKVTEIARLLNKIPVEVNDYPGFIANRILMPMINEAIYSLYEGVAGVTEIDTVMKLGLAHPMGPLQLADFIGLDVCLAILKVLHNGFGNPKYAPCPLLVNMVAAGKVGVKTGEGFYDYSSGTKNAKASVKFS